MLTNPMMNVYRNRLCIFHDQMGNLGGVPNEKVNVGGKHCNAASGGSGCVYG